MPPPSTRPNVWTRLRIRAAGEIPIDDLRAYRAASLEVWSFVESASERRRTGVVAPVENLAAWIVFALQTYGNALMDADAHADPATADYIGPETHGLVLRLYGPIGGWLTRGHEGRGASARLRRKSPLALPRPSQPDCATVIDGNALLIVVRAMAGELSSVAAVPSPPVQARIDAALAAARYAEGLLPTGTTLGATDLARLGPALRKAAADLFRAGQVAAWPAFESSSQRKDAP